jgi:ABC-type amino acid transport substrate-binding protein
MEIIRQMLQPHRLLLRRPTRSPLILEVLQCPFRFASGLFAYVLLSTFAGPAQAETSPRLDAIVAGGILRAGLTEDYRPFSFADASGKVEGIDVDMAMSLAQSLGVKLDIVKTSRSTPKTIWKRTVSTSRWVGSPSPSIARKWDCSPAPSFQAARRRSRVAGTNLIMKRSRRSISPVCT